MVLCPEYTFENEPSDLEHPQYIQHLIIYVTSPWISKWTLQVKEDFNYENTNFEFCQALSNRMHAVDGRK